MSLCCLLRSTVVQPDKCGSGFEMRERPMREDDEIECCFYFMGGGGGRGDRREDTEFAIHH
jgi:hypothetical protein